MINNAANFPFAKTNQMPNMAQTLQAWLIPLTFGVVTKQQNGFFTREVVVKKSFDGVWQPLTYEQLKVKNEGERSWKWFWCHTLIDLGLKPDDVIIYQGTQYRVMGAKDYSLNGFYEYELVEDFRDAGPWEEEDEEEEPTPEPTPDPTPDPGPEPDNPDDNPDGNTDPPTDDNSGADDNPGATDNPDLPPDDSEGTNVDDGEGGGDND